jgi:hypothetical protein
VIETRRRQLKEAGMPATCPTCGSPRRIAETVRLVHMDAFDVVRHKIVQQIVEAYRRFDDARRAEST